MWPLKAVSLSLRSPEEQYLEKKILQKCCSTGKCEEDAGEAVDSRCRDAITARAIKQQITRLPIFAVLITLFLSHVY